MPGSAAPPSCVCAHACGRAPGAPRPPTMSAAQRNAAAARSERRLAQATRRRRRPRDVVPERNFNLSATRSLGGCGSDASDAAAMPAQPGHARIRTPRACELNSNRLRRPCVVAAPRCCWPMAQPAPPHAPPAPISSRSPLSSLSLLRIRIRARRSLLIFHALRLRLRPRAAARVRCDWCTKRTSARAHARARARN